MEEIVDKKGICGLQEASSRPPGFPFIFVGPARCQVEFVN